MSADSSNLIAGRLIRPEPISGRVVDVDCGYSGAIVLTVEADGSRYYETYELTAVNEDSELERNWGEGEVRR